MELQALAIRRRLGATMELAQLSQDLYRLSGRFGPRPRSSDGLPFRQLDQFPPAETIRRLLQMCRDLPHVRMRQSRVARPQSRALWLPDSVASGPPSAFIDAGEFSHLHAPPEGGIHLTLPSEVVESVVALGWAERHPIHNLGIFDTLVMVYAPRDPAEIDVVFALIEHSCRYAKGELAGSRAITAQRILI
jgi:phospholipase/carboxylesterase